MTSHLGLLLAQAARGLDPVDARHAQVHEHDLGPVLGAERERLLAVGRGGHELDAVEQPEQRADALAHEALVVGEQDADRPVLTVGRGVARAHRRSISTADLASTDVGSRSSTRKPSRVGSASSSPPSSSARSRIPVRP